MKTLYILAATVSSTVLCPALVQAQTVLDTPPAPAVLQGGAAQAAPTTAGGQASANPEANAATGLGDLVVTAQRRSESLQRAAIAVSAIGGEDLMKQGITTTQGLTKAVPALQILPGGGPYTLFYLRGVGNLNANAYADTAVAFNVDNIYFSRPISASGVFYDVERVEVVKGPQGTLYGRNATGGAINVITRKPTFNSNATINMEYGNYDQVHVDAAANVPLSSTVAIRIAGQTVRHDGYLKYGYDDQQDVAGRIQLRADLTPDLTVNLQADTFEQRGKGPGSSIVPTAAGADLRDGLHSPAADAAFVRAGGAPLADIGYMNNHLSGVSANIAWTTPIGTLTVLPAYRGTRQDFITDVPGFKITDNENDKQRSVEVRLASGGSGRFSYVIGGFFFDEDIGAVQIYDQQRGSGNLQDIALHTRSVAGFGQATLSLTDRFRLTGGARYTREDKTQTGTSTTMQGRGVTSATPGDASFSNVSYKGGIEFDVAPASLFYASYATGFKAGGFYSAPPPNSYDPEKIRATTIGLKNRFLDNKVQLNAELFYWKYRNQQVSYLSGRFQGGGFVPVFPTGNVGRSTIKGAEVELRVRPAANTTLSVDAQYLHARYDSFTYELLSFGPPQIGCPFAPGRVVGPFRTVIATCDGRQMPQAPAFSMSAGLSQTLPLASGGSFVLDLRTKYEASRWTSIEYLAVERSGHDHMSDAILTYNVPGNRLYIAGFVNNIENRDVISRTSPHPLFPLVTASLRPPRTYGVRLGANF